MTEKSEKPAKTEPPSIEEYKQMGAKLYGIIQEVESNTYTPNPEKELSLLELTMVFNELQKARIEQAGRAEHDLKETNLETLDPQAVINSAQVEYEESGRTPEDDARRWGNVFYAQPLQAVDQAIEAHKLIQDRGLSRLEKSLGLKYPAKDFPEIEKFGTSEKQSPREKIEKKGKTDNPSNN